MHVPLDGRQRAGAGLQLDAVDTAVVKKEEIGDAASDAERLEDSRLNGRPLAASRVMAPERIGGQRQVEEFADSVLKRLLGAAPAHHTTHQSDRVSRRAICVREGSVLGTAALKLLAE